MGSALAGRLSSALPPGPGLPQAEVTPRPSLSCSRRQAPSLGARLDTDRQLKVPLLGLQGPGAPAQANVYDRVKKWLMTSYRGAGGQAPSTPD